MRANPRASLRLSTLIHASLDRSLIYASLDSSLHFVSFAQHTLKYDVKTPCSTANINMITIIRTQSVFDGLVK
jgi:hypothetical protein